MPIRFARPIHPGEYLREEYLAPLSMTAGNLAKRLGVPRTRIERLVLEEVGISPDTALRLAKAFNTYGAAPCESLQHVRRCALRKPSTRTALRLAKAFNTTPAFWLNFQNGYDLEIAAQKIGDEIAKIDPIVGADQAA
ncbi:HigA family addiction module antitoxin [Jiella marina]